MCDIPDLSCTEAQQWLQKFHTLKNILLSRTPAINSDHLEKNELTQCFNPNNAFYQIFHWTIFQISKLILTPLVGQAINETSTE